MEESIFEYLERTRFVDYLLLWLAILGPMAVAGVAYLLRGKPVVEAHRHHWLLALAAAPALFGMWKAYNAIMDLYGLDSVFALAVNVCIFLAAALAFILLEKVGERFFCGSRRAPKAPAGSATPAEQAESGNAGGTDDQEG
jgi:hypothetical protein